MLEQTSSSQKGHNLHDEFFKKIFKHPKYLLELLHIIFSAKFVAAFDATSLIIKDGMLLKRAGGEMRTDLSAAACLKNTDMEVTITFILEHKSYRDPEVILQTMEYYLRARREQLRQRRRGEPHNLIIPVVLICCKDKDFEPPQDDLVLEFGEEKIPPVLQEFRDMFPPMPCQVVDLRKLPLDELWGEARENGTEPRAALTALQGMAGVWEAGDDTVAALLSKGRMLAPEDRTFILENLKVYYESADNMICEGDFTRVDRERWPELAQEERLETMLETQSDRAERRGIEQGMQQGIKKGKLDTARHLLLEGVDERIICKAAQLSKQALAKIKRDLKQT